MQGTPGCVVGGREWQGVRREAEVKLLHNKKGCGRRDGSGEAEWLRGN